MTYYENIPDELKALKRWVCVSDDSKVPMRAFEGCAASSTDSFTWSSFEEAREAVEAGIYANLGFVFAERDGFVGIDIDRGFDKDGVIIGDVLGFINKSRSYTEVSRSGRGFHIILRGTLPFKGFNNGYGFEIYKAERYFIVTGDVRVYRTIRENQPVIDYAIENYCQNVTRSPTTPNLRPKAYQAHWGGVQGKTLPLKVSYDTFGTGCRHTNLLSIAGTLLATGHTVEETAEKIVLINQQYCTPPLPDKELTNVMRSVRKYAK